MMENINRINQTHQLTGILCKYTNVVKGWQYRYFTVDGQTGKLSYYLCDSNDDNSIPQNINNLTPRGQVDLAAAVVCPSDEDSKTFSISCASGDIIKLRASDARARQEWVDGLRAIAEVFTQVMDNSITLPPRELLAASDAFVVARQQLQQTEWCNATLSRTIENINGPFSPTDPDLLILKAISNTSTQCLHQCLTLLQNYQDSYQNNYAGESKKLLAGAIHSAEVKK